MQSEASKKEQTIKNQEENFLGQLWNEALEMRRETQTNMETFSIRRASEESYQLQKFALL